MARHVHLLTGLRRGNLANVAGEKPLVADGLADRLVDRGQARELSAEELAEITGDAPAPPAKSRKRKPKADTPPADTPPADTPEGPEIVPGDPASADGEGETPPAGE